MTVTLHVGPKAGVVHVTIGNDERNVMLPRDGSLDMVVPLAERTALVPVSIAAPAAVDAHSTDQRNLGCQVRIRLS
jgi:hypothetical protein